MQGKQYNKSHVGLKSESVWFKIKLISRFLTLSFLLSQPFYIPHLNAAPVGGEVVGGSGSISQSDLTTTINQSTQNLAVDWQSFDVNVDERVQFIQPNSSSIALNRILGNNGSTIQGQIDANGQVILINPNGIFFTPTATINVGGLIASSLDMTPSDFMNGNYIFNEVIGADGAVINSGIINASVGGDSGGNVALIGKQVNNEGLISAKLGSVVLAAGKQSVLTFDNQGLIGVTVTKEVLQSELGLEAAVINSGEIKAAGGRVLLTASTSQDVFSQSVNNHSLNQATSVIVNADGSFTLGNGADVLNTGSIDVSSQFNESNTARIILLGENVTNSGNLNANITNGTAGEIELHAKDKTLLTEESITSAEALESGTGGLIKILGDKVGLFDQAQVNASGANGGGEVLIGGDRRGLNTSVRNANFIYLADNTSVKADATKNGDGGKIITFAKDTARIYGNLFARGGIYGGNGGFIETSGLKGFEINNTPDVTAANGLSGEWLIDPYNIRIVGFGGATRITQSGVPVDTFTSNNYDSRINVSLIETALSGGAIVTIVTSNAGNTVQDGIDDSTGIGEDGNITLETDLNYNGSGAATLTLQAENDIVFLADISITDESIVDNDLDSLNLNLYAKGDIDIRSGVTVNTQGGTFTAGNGTDYIPTSFVNSGTIITSGAFTGTNTTRVNTVGGEISITTLGALTTGVLTSTSREVDKDLEPNAGDGRDGLNGGKITLKSGGLLLVDGNITANGGLADDTSASRPNRGGTGGEISLESTLGNVRVTASILSKGGEADGNNSNVAKGGDGGVISLKAANDIDIQVSGSVVSEGGQGDGGTGSGAGFGGDAGAITIDVGNNFILSGNLSSIGGLPNQDTINYGANSTITINGDATQNIFTINSGATLTGSVINIYGLGQDDSFNIGLDVLGTNSSSSELLDGGAGDDTFIFTTNGVRTTILGGVGSDTIVSDSSNSNATSWIINNSNAGSLTNNTAQTNFTLVENLTGNMQQDIFAFNATTSWIDGLIDGGVNSTASVLDTLTISILDIPVTVQLGTDSITSSELNVNNIETITADGALSNTLKGANFASDWQIDGSGDGYLRPTTGFNRQNRVDFNGFHNLTANVALDQFTFGSGGWINGQILGGDNTVTTEKDTLNINALTATTIQLGTGPLSDAELNVDQFETITANSAVTHTLKSENIASDWSITGSGDGTLSPTAGATTQNTVDFIDFHNLTASASLDQFSFGASGWVNGLMLGGNNTVASQQDTLSIVLLGSTTVQLGSTITPTSGVLNVDQFESISANSSVSNTLIGDDVTTTWTVSSTNSGNLAPTVGANGQNTVIFNDFNILTGGDQVDTFTLNADVTGQVNGGTVNLGTSNQDDIFNISVNITGSLNGQVGDDVFNINSTALALTSISGGAGTDTILTNTTGEENYWLISSANGQDGKLYHTLADRIADTNIGVTYTGVENLTGGTANDNFKFAVDSTIAGVLDGNELTGDNDVVDFSDLTSPITITLGSSANLINIENIIGSGSGGSSLIGDDFDTIWNITSTNAGNLSYNDGASNQSLIFSNFNILTGGDQVDTFNLGADITGQVNGGMTNIVTSNQDDIFNIASNITGVLNGQVGVDTFNIDTINLNIASINGGTGNDIINAAGETNFWLIEGVGSGRIFATDPGNIAPFVGIPRVTFTNVVELNGRGLFDDTYIFTLNPASSGIIADGGPHLTRDIVRLADNLSNMILVAGSFTNVERYVGNTNSNTLQGASGASTINTWSIEDLDGTGGTVFDDQDDGRVNGIEFINFTTLLGGTGNSTDNYTIVDSAFISDINGINGNGGADSLTGPDNPVNNWVINNADAGSISGSSFVSIQTLNGGTGQDIFDLSNANASISTAINGGTIILGNSSTYNTIISRNTDNTWTINNVDTGTLSVTTPLPTQYANFTSIQNLTGGNGVQDIFDLSNANASISGLINGGTFTLGNTNTYNTIISRDEATSWTITNGNKGTIADTATVTTYANFSSVQNLRGAATNDDIFTFTALGDLSGLIDGRGDATVLGDRVNLVARTAASTVEIDNSVSTNINVYRVEGIRANASVINTLFARVGANDWQIYDNLVEAGGAVNDGSVNSILFNNFNNLTGADLAVDTFTIADNARITGTINGGTYNATSYNILNGQNLASDWSITGSNSGFITLSGSPTRYVNQFLNIQTLNGGGAADQFSLTSNTAFIENTINGGTTDLFDSATYNTLVAFDTGSNWGITNLDRGSITGTATGTPLFTNIQNLTGALTQNDLFIFSDAATLSGLIDGRGQTTQDMISLTAFTSDATITAGSDFINIERLDANGSFDNTLVGTTGNNNWQITNIDDGTLNTTTSFFNFNILAGNDTGTTPSVDDFTFTTNGQLTGYIDGAGGAFDTLNVELLNDVEVFLSNNNPNTNNDHVYAVNIEEITASISNSFTKRINGAHANSSWVIDGVDTGTVNPTGNTSPDATTRFVNFNNVLGGYRDDLIQFALIGAGPAVGSITGDLDANETDDILIPDNDQVNYSSQILAKTISLEDGSAFGSVLNAEGIIGNGINMTLEGDNIANTWDITSENGGVINDLIPADRMTFSGFNFLQGNDQVDIFNVNPLASATKEGSIGTLNASVFEGEIFGGGGNDVLNVYLTGVENGQVRFDGGGQTDQVNLISSISSGSYTGSYSPNEIYSFNLQSYEQFKYTHSSSTPSTSAIFTVNYRQVASVQDDVAATSFTINGTNRRDNIDLQTGTFQLSPIGSSVYSALPINYTNKTNIIVNGGIRRDVLNLTGDISVGLAGELTFDVETIVDNLMTITAGTLNLNNVTTAGASTPLLLNVTNLAVTNSGNIYVNDNDGLGLILTGLNNTTLLDILANGTVSSASQLNSSGRLNITASSGDISLTDPQNLLSGALNFTAINGNITLVNNTTTSIEGINTNDLNITSTGNITQTGIINARNLTNSATTILQSEGDITLLALANDFDDLTVNNAVNVRINDIDDLAVTNIDATGIVNITSNGLSLGRINSNDITLNSGSGAITDNNGNLDNIISAGSINLTASGGIGSGNALELALSGGNASLTATNSDAGDIDIIKDGNLLLENIKNIRNNTSGAFSIVSNGGNLTIKSIVLDYDDPSAKADFTFFSPGHIYGDTNAAPHITANSAIFTMNASGSVGKSNNEPIITNVKDYIEVTEALGTYIRYYNVFKGTFVGDNEYKNLALQIIENLAGQQLIQVESLAEIDPAIFTDVKNYNHSDVALMMPSDQRYDISDDEEDEEAKQKREKFLNSTP